MFGGGYVFAFNIHVPLAEWAVPHCYDVCNTKHDHTIGNSDSINFSNLVVIYEFTEISLSCVQHVAQCMVTLLLICGCN